MGLFDFLKKKKNKGAEVERSMPLTLDGFDPNAVTPPDTRYTQEYQDFLASQEAAQNRACTDAEAAAAEEGSPEDTAGEAGPCTECGETAAPPEAAEEELREYCDVVDEAVEEAASGEELPEDVPVDVVAPEEDDIISNE